jgi:hypothetical protein
MVNKRKMVDVLDLSGGSCEGVLRMKLQEAYDYLYDAANKIITADNPCRISNARCVGDKICCSGCRFLSHTGCTVRALACKIHVCKAAQANLSKQHYILLQHIRLEAERLDIFFPRRRLEDIRT